MEEEEEEVKHELKFIPQGSLLVKYYLATFKK